MITIFPQLSYRFQNIYFAMEYILGKDFVFWPQNKPLYDLIDETGATHLFCEQHRISKEVFSVIRNTNIKLVILGAGVDQSLIDINQPSLVCCPNDVTLHVKNQLKMLNCPVIYLKDCANIVHYNTENLKIKSEVGFLSTSQPNEYTSYEDNINILRAIGLSSHQLKVVGPKFLPIPEYLGYLELNKFTSFYQSVDINLDFDGRNILDIAISRAFCLSNVINSLYPHYKDVRELIDSIESFKNKPKARNKIARTAFEKVIQSDTSLHRLENILEALEQKELVYKCQQSLETITNAIRNNDKCS